MEKDFTAILMLGLLLGGGGCCTATAVGDREYEMLPLSVPVDVITLPGQLLIWGFLEISGFDLGGIKG